MRSFSTASRLLTQKIQMGDALDNQTMIGRRLSYIHVILRR